MDPIHTSAPGAAACSEAPVPAPSSAAPQPYEAAFQMRERIYSSPFRTQNISLVPVTDREYWLRGQSALRESGKLIASSAPKCIAELEFGAQMSRFASQMEEPARRWLGSCIKLSDSRVILFSKFDGSTGEWRKKFFEVDAVSVAGNVPDVLFEIKVGFKGQLRGLAEKQLVKRAEVLSSLHPHTRCAVVYVICNPSFQPRGDEIAVGEDLVLDLSEFYRRLLGPKIPCVTVELEPLLAFAEGVGASPQPELIKIVQSEQARRREEDERRKRDGGLLE